MTNGSGTHLQGYPDLERRNLRLRQNVVMLAVLLIGIILILIAERNSDISWMNIVGEVGAFLSASVMVHMIYHQFIRQEEQAYLLERLGTAVEEKLLSTDARSGIVASHEKLKLEEFGHAMERARLEIRILQTFIGGSVAYEPTLVDALRRGVRVRIILTKPSSEYAFMRAMELGLDPEAVNVHVKGNRTILRRIWMDAGCSKLLELRFYDRTVPMSIQGADGRMFVGFAWLGRQNSMGPQLISQDARTDAYWSKAVNDQFERAWKDAEPVPFTEDV